MRLFAIVCGLLLPLLTASFVRAEEPTKFEVSEGKMVFTAPKGWVKKKPASRIVEVEFEAPAVERDEKGGRLTVMGAGGSVEENLNRWYGQFTQPDGKSTKEAAKVQKMSVAGQEVHYVDIAGTYKDQPGGPFAGGQTVMRDDYRMLGAIVRSKEAGNYFLKFYGPKKTIDANEKAFQTLVESLEIK
jgi:hypothetical protein